jgi:outer membrane protein
MAFPFSIRKIFINIYVIYQPSSKEGTVKKIFCFGIIAGFFLVSLSNAQSGKTGSSLKIAYVNSATIIRELPEAQQVQKDLEANVKVWQDELEKMSKELQDGLDDYQKKKDMMDPKAKEDKEKSLQQLQTRAREYQYQKFDTREGEAVKMREQKFAPIQARILEAIEKTAKEDGFTYVFDKMENATILLFADPKFDLTYKVIDRLKRGAASEKTK